MLHIQMRRLHLQHASRSDRMPRLGAYSTREFTVPSVVVRWIAVMQVAASHRYTDRHPTCSSPANLVESGLQLPRLQLFLRALGLQLGVLCQRIQ